jgi:hypothetical protein
MYERDISLHRFNCNTATHPARVAATTYFAVSILVATMMTAPAPLLAATTVRGQLTDMQLQTKDASIREVLDALSSAFKLTYKLPPNVSRQVSGVYTGTLHQVLRRILDGDNYIVEMSDGSTKVLVLGRSGNDTAIPAMPPAIPHAARVVTANDNAAALQAPVPKPVPPLSSFR